MMHDCTEFTPTLESERVEQFVDGELQWATVIVPRQQCRTCWWVQDAPDSEFWRLVARVRLVVPTWTTAQHEALVRFAERHDANPIPLARSASPLFMGNGCQMVSVNGVWYGIEPDGYCHS